MKIGIILETKENEKARNAFRFAVTAKKLGHEVKLNETDACPISTMVDCVDLVVWADKVVNF